jgi:type II secretory pathway component GspD/PulD (secretin)
VIDRFRNRIAGAIPNRPIFSANDLIAWSLVLVAWGVIEQESNPIWAQQPLQINVQQPVIRQFSVNTVVSVPDGGTISLGGIRRSSEGSLQVGIPGWGSMPAAGRLFQSRSLGIAQSANHASVTVHIISMKEMEQRIMTEADRRQLSQPSVDLKGSPAVQKKSDFILRNLGRR